VFARLNTPLIKLATRSVSLITCKNGNIHCAQMVFLTEFLSFLKNMFIAKMRLLDGTLPFPW
jgi:hypothetical protein